MSTKIRQMNRKSNFDTKTRYMVEGLGCDVIVESAYHSEGIDRTETPLTISRKISVVNEALDFVHSIVRDIAEKKALKGYFLSSEECDILGKGIDILNKAKVELQTNAPAPHAKTEN